jgi:hypothetical protein
MLMMSGIVVAMMMMMDVVAMAMLGMARLGARKFKERFNVVMIGIERFQGV